MKVLGIRCSTNDFTYAVISGSQDTPELMKLATVAFPASYSQPEKLKWLLDEFTSLNRDHKPTKWAVKGSEPMAAKGKSYASRVEFEAMLFLSVAQAGGDYAVRKVKATIAKDLGLKGRPKALQEDLDFSKVDGLENTSNKEFDAITVAWSCL